MDRSENLRYILRTLLDERAEYAGAQIPDSLTELQRLMRALQNVRPPAPVSREFLEAQDAELRMRRRAALTIATGPVAAFPAMPNCKGEPFSHILGTPLQCRAFQTISTAPVAAFPVLPSCKGEPFPRILGTPCLILKKVDSQTYKKCIICAQKLRRSTSRTSSVFTNQAAAMERYLDCCL